MRFGQRRWSPSRLGKVFLVVGEPVEHALPYDRHHDLDRVGLPDMRAQNVVRMFDGADYEDVPAHDGNVPPRRAGFAADSVARFEVCTGVCTTRA